MKTPSVKPSLLSSGFMNEPRVIKDINTEYGTGNELCSVSCLRENEFWTRGWDKILRLYNLQGELLKSVQTISGNMPSDMSVIQNLHCVYTDYDDRSINIVQNTQIQPMIKLRGWKPLNV